MGKRNRTRKRRARDRQARETFARRGWAKVWRRASWIVGIVGSIASIFGAYPTFRTFVLPGARQELDHRVAVVVECPERAAEPIRVTCPAASTNVQAALLPVASEASLSVTAVNPVKIDWTVTAQNLAVDNSPFFNFPSRGVLPTSPSGALPGLQVASGGRFSDPLTGLWLAPPSRDDRSSLLDYGKFSAGSQGVLNVGSPGGTFNWASTERAPLFVIGSNDGGNRLGGGAILNATWPTSTASRFDFVAPKGGDAARPLDLAGLAKNHAPIDFTRFGRRSDDSIVTLGAAYLSAKSALDTPSIFDYVRPLTGSATALELGARLGTLTLPSSQGVDSYFTANSDGRSVRLSLADTRSPIAAINSWPSGSNSLIGSGALSRQPIDLTALATDPSARIDFSSLPPPPTRGSLPSSNVLPATIRLDALTLPAT